MQRVAEDPRGLGPMDTPHWSDTFYVSPKQREEISTLFRDFLEDAAHICRLDTSEWDEEDFEIFEEIIL